MCIRVSHPWGASSCMECVFAAKGEDRQSALSNTRAHDFGALKYFHKVDHSGRCFMNSRISFAWIMMCGLLLSSIAAAQEAPLKMNVWPGKAPGDSGQVGPAQWTKMRVTNVTEPTLTIIRPQKGKNTGMAIIVCPGGGYSALMMDYEGTDVAQWLASQGITGIVLKYRVPAPKGTRRYLPGLQDAQRTISIVRSKAAEWQIDPRRVGILGFSAGGHLAAATSTNF